jgi:hypothetical protein
MPSDDVAPLFAGEPSQGLRLRQGTVVAFNTTTRQNTVTVDGQTFTDLPMLFTGENLAAGNVVAIVTAGGSARSWFILGRIRNPTS